ncbi:MAG: DUF4838 domain-containing protein [Candidatus Omnitrophica bacterium]|nr:DUF4838 domain-containing protein [Candidatus Omnitrophota bacterium]
MCFKNIKEIALFLFIHLIFLLSCENLKPEIYYSFEEEIESMIYNKENDKFTAIGTNLEKVEGVVGKGVRFNGVNSYIKTGIIDLKNTDYSYEVWIKPEDDFSKGEFYIFGPQQWDQMGLKIKNNVIRMWHRKGGTWDKGGGKFISISAYYEFKKDIWYHVVGTFSTKNGMALYVNGELVALNPYANEPSDWHICLIGAGTTYGRVKEEEYSGALHSFFKGIIDEVKIYRKELNSKEVKTSYINTKSFKIVFNGKPMADILISENATPLINFSADELQKYIKKITGVEIPVVKIRDFKQLESLYEFHIVIGENELSKTKNLTTENLKTDGYIIKREKNMIFILGKDTNLDPKTHHTKWLGSAGTLYGVYKLLEILGVRFFFPDEELEVIPNKKELFITDDLETIENPYFRMRLCWGLNTEWTRKIGYGGDEDAWASGHTFEGKRSGINFWTLYKDTNPEFFSIDKNGRIYNHIAFPHKGVIDKIVEHAEDYFKKGRNFFIVCPNDYFMDICSCDLCQSKVDKSREETGIYSNYVGEAVIEVAKRLKNKFPDKYIVYLAYEKYLLPPTIVEKLPENVVSLIAFPCLDKIKKGKLNLGEQIIDETKYNLIEDWQNLKPQRIYLLEYYTFGNNFIPIFIPHLISQHIKKLKEISEKVNFSQISGMGIFTDSVRKENFWWYAINHYVTAKLLWNPELDVDEILEDFYLNFFGPAYEDMKKMFEYIECLYYRNPKRAIYNKDEVEFIINCVEKAKQKVEGTVYEKRVKYIDDGLFGLKSLKQKLTYENLELSKDNLIVFYDFSGKNEELVKNKVNEMKYEGIISNGKLLYDEELKKEVLFFNGKTFIDIKGGVNLKDKDYLIFVKFKLESLPSEKETFYILGPEMWDRIGLKLIGKKVEFIHRNNGRFIKINAYLEDITPSKWYEIVVTFSKKDGMAIYLDKNLISYNNLMNLPASWSLKYIGASGHPEGMIGYFKGWISEVKIYVF